jgi:uncharacterized RDD family membrane protein YckC
MTGSFGASTGAAVAHQPEPAQPDQMPLLDHPAIIEPEPAVSKTIEIDLSPRTNDTIVEAALNRVRKAVDPPVRPSPASRESTRKLTANSFVPGDRHATARALEIETEIAPLTTSPLPEIQETDLDAVDTRTLFIADEIEPCDYLEAEVRKVDRKLAAEFARNESPSLAVHLVIALADIIVIGFSSAPFMVLINATIGFDGARSRPAAGMILAIISFFYLTVTQALCGKTFGMMLTNTRVVDSESFESISPGRALARTIGYFVALAPAAVGFLWAVVNKKRRGWHDLISGTLVARDF